MTIRDLIEMGANLDTPIYIRGHIYDQEGTGDLIAKYENANGVDTAQITDDSIVLFGDVESIPTADVEPVRHGRWMPDEVIGGMQDYKCSVCGAVISETFMMQFNGCPYCLAKMDGGEK